MFKQTLAATLCRFTNDQGEEHMRFFTQGLIDGLDKTTEAGFAEALLIAMSNLKDEQGLLLNVRLSDDFNQQIDFAKQIARMMVKEKNT